MTQTTFQEINFTVQQICIMTLCLKRQNIAVLCQQTFCICSAVIFLDHVLLPAELVQKFKLLQN